MFYPPTALLGYHRTQTASLWTTSPLHRPLDAGGARRGMSKNSQGGLGEALLSPPRGALVIPSTSGKGCALPTKLAVIVRAYHATKIEVIHSPQHLPALHDNRFLRLIEGALKA